MGNELYLTGQFLAVLRGESVDERWRASWNDNAIINGRGSANIPLLAAAVGFYQTHRDHDRATWNRLVDWLGRYYQLPLMAHEPGSRTYWAWMILPLAAIGHLLRRIGGHDELVALHARKLRAFWAFAAAGAAPSPAKKQRIDFEIGRFTGPFSNWIGTATTMCGARCNTSWKGPKNVRFDPVTKEPNFVQYIQEFSLDYVLAVVIGKLELRTASATQLWERDVIRAIARNAPEIPFSALTDDEAAVLRRIVHSLAQPPRRRDVEQLVAWLGEWLPKVTFRILRTRKGIASVGLRSTNTGSTNYLYAVTWNAQTHKLDFLGLDDPRFRSEGLPGVAEVDLEKRVVSGLRKDGRTFTWPEDYRAQPKTLALPAGQVLLDLTIARGGVSFKLAEASEASEAGEAEEGD